MTADDIRIIRYMDTDTRRFSFWMIFLDNRFHYLGKKAANKSLIKFLRAG